MDSNKQSGRSLDPSSPQLYQSGFHASAYRPPSAVSQPKASASIEKFSLCRSIIVSAILLTQTAIACVYLTLDPTSIAPYAILVLASGQLHYFSVRLQPSVLKCSEDIMLLAMLYIPFGLWGLDGVRAYSTWKHSK